MRVIPLMLLVAAIAACGENERQAPAGEPAATEIAAAASADACSILNKQAAEKALGRPVDKLDNDGGAAALEICQYGYQGEKLMDMGNVSLTYHPNDLATMRQGLVAEKATIEEVPGLGDGAIYTPEFGLYVGKGGRTAIYLLAAGGMDQAEAKKRTIALAHGTVGRL
ncbi:MAG TPA: hypothetical protein VNA29_02125 [Sphingomicrobium sp.]|nr:hypothetical protein [Sphingomicrobium sp.]